MLAFSSASGLAADAFAPAAMIVAIDVAILLPSDISARAVQLSAALPGHESQGLRLGDDALPHVTLTQQFVREDQIHCAAEAVAAAIADTSPLRLTITGPERGSNSLWMAIERTRDLLACHGRLMDTLRAYEVQGGTAAAFANGYGRPRDVEWVGRFRRDSSFDNFHPHITVGHGTALPVVEPVTFDANVVALCRLGRFCTCARVVRRFVLRS